MKEKLLASFQAMADAVMTAAPKVIFGIVLFALAIVVAKVVERLLRVFLERMQLDSLVERAGLDKTLQRIGIRQRLNQFLPRLVYFLLLLLLAKTLADTMGLAAISDAFNAFFEYLPNIVAALLLIVLGGAVAQFVGMTITQAGESSGVEFAPALGRVVSGLLLFMVGIMALAQLRIDTEMVRIVTSFILAGLALAFGLSFGFGTRDITRNLVAGYYARKVLQVGERIEIAGQRGVLRAITPTHAIVETEEESIRLANTTFLDEIAKQ